MSIRIIKSGVLDTIQDEGRFGFQYLGINPGGAMDSTAMRIANALAGNSSGKPVIEMHFPAAEIVFDDTLLVALSGADFSPMINDSQIAMLQPLIVQKGSVLRFGKQIKGARAYLSVQGGWAADDWLDSSSTNLKVKAGGFHGRALLKNDRLYPQQEMAYQLTADANPFMAFPWRAGAAAFYHAPPFRFIAGAEYDILPPSAKEQLTNAVFTIDQHSDRMGYRLQSNPLIASFSGGMISTAVTKGTMQLLPDGQLIALMADHQTTGGYPRVGHIISADIASLAQMHAGQAFSFQQTDMATAEMLAYRYEQNLQQLQNACNFRLQEYLHK